MLDRLISGAGAVTDAADRAVRSLTSGSRRRIATVRPGSLAIAGLLVVLSLLLVLAGLEGMDPSTPIAIAPADAATSRALGDRTFSTMHGSLDAAYVETFSDDNDNGLEDPGESGIAWYYWLVDPDARAGVTVRSTRPPSAVYTFSGRGLVIPDPRYLTEDRTATNNEIASAGLQLDPATVIDGTVAMPLGGAAVDLGGALPTVGSEVWLSGPRLGSWVRACRRDLDGDGSCEPDESDLYEIVVFDPATKHAIRAYVVDLPEFSPASLTGILRREERAVDDALGTRGFGFDDLDIKVSDRYILDDAAAPRRAPLAFLLAAALFSLAVVIVCGLAGGYLVFRRSEGRLPPALGTLAPDERIPLRISGLVRTPAGLEHVREAPGELVRFVLGLRSILVVERTGHPHGVELGTGSVARLSSGLAMTFQAPRPAVRVVAGTGPLILSFDTETDRDRAAAEVLDETGLGPDGRPVPTADGTPVPTADGTPVPQPIGNLARQPERSDMDAWEYDDVETARSEGGHLYHEFLRVPDLSAGIYVLEAGATDPQSPHTEDELYYVIAGRALVTVGAETRSVVPGSLVFVAAGDPHRFHDIDERLELLVAFGPAEGARARLP